MAQIGPPKLRERSTRTIVVDGKAIEVRVRESSRARSARLVIGPRRPLELVVPRRVTNATIDRILEARHDWIREQTGRIQALASTQDALGLERTGYAPLGGRHLPIVQTPATRAVAELRDRRLEVGGPAGQAGAAIERWYRREARRQFEAVAAREGARLGLELGRIAIRDQRSRWGSCSSSGTLSFNWRLVLALPEVLEYVVVHELCHLREPNHSKRFWALVTAASPDWKSHSRWLNEHAYELHAFDPVRLVATADRNGA